MTQKDFISNNKVFDFVLLQNMPIALPSLSCKTMCYTCRVSLILRLILVWFQVLEMSVNQFVPQHGTARPFLFKVIKSFGEKLFFSKVPK